MSSSRVSALPPAQILSDADVGALRQWAFSALTDGLGDSVIQTLGRLQKTRPRAPSWESAWNELHVRTGIALDRPHLVAMAAVRLLHDRCADESPEVLLPLAVGAQWLVEDAMKHAGPAVRFGQSRPMLSAARWALARALSSGTLEPAGLAEGAAALDRLYAGAWRERDPAAGVTFDRNTPAAIVALHLDLRAAGTASPEDRMAIAGDVLWQVARSCEPSWPAHGGPWWTSQTYGLTIDISAPRTTAERHRFALADVFLEVDDVESISADEGFHEEAAEPLAAHLHELATQAVAHAVRSGLATGDQPCRTC